MKRKMAILAALALCLFLLGAGSTSAGQGVELKSQTMTWVAGGVGGGWYVQAGGIARLIKDKEPKLVIKVVPGGGVVNPVRVSMHKDDLGWGITFVDKMALKGLKPIYKKAYPDVRSLGGIFGIYHIHFVAAQDTGIQTVAELAKKIQAGEKVKVAAPMKGTSDLPLVQNILDFYGVSLDDIKNAGGKVFHAVYADMVNLYKDKHVDYVFTHLALPGAAVTEMAVSRDTKLLDVSDDCIEHVHNSLGTLAQNSGHAVIPSGTYRGQDRDVAAIASAGELLINKDVPDEVAYRVIQIICENIDELHSMNKANKHFVPKRGWRDVAVPLHPGAEKFYKDAGYMPE
ncbi:MAG: TAXI family TRAP transporter solute-binding subunit [Desulfovermiculus sp.]|nr:TAXI family TRAP transporter solute-binding subunit [Desulfovermiculus sp.]